MQTEPQDFLQRALKDGHLQLITSGKTEKIRYVAVNVSGIFLPDSHPRILCHQRRRAPGRGASSSMRSGLTRESTQRGGIL